MRGLIQRFQTLTLLPDWILVQQAKLGEKEAFGRLYEKYLDRLYRYVFYRCDQRKELAEDLVQTVFIKAWEKIELFDKGSFQAWLYTIARNTLIDHIRVQKVQEQLDENMMDEKKSIEEQAHTTLQVDQVMQHLSLLTEEQQEVVLLRFVNELSYKEIAQALDKKEDAVRALQYRALKELRERMNNDR